MRIIVRVEYPSAGCNLRVTDVDGRRVTAFATNQTGDVTTLDLRHRARGRCEQQIKNTKDTGLAKMGAPVLRRQPDLVCHGGAGDVSVPLVGDVGGGPGGIGRGEEGGLAVADGDPHPRETPDGTPIPVPRPSAKHKWWLWEPKTWRAKMGSIAALVTRHARRLTVRFDEAMEYTGTLIAAITRIRSLSFI